MLSVESVRSGFLRKRSSRDVAKRRDPVPVTLSSCFQRCCCRPCFADEETVLGRLRRSVVEEGLEAGGPLRKPGVN